MHSEEKSLKKRLGRPNDSESMGKIRGLALDRSKDITILLNEINR